MPNKVFRFANNIMAAAFCAAVAANHKEIDTDHLDACELSDPSTRLIGIDDEDQTLSLIVYDEPEVGATKVSTLVELEQAIGDALAMRPQTEADEQSNETPTGTVALSATLPQKDNPVGREIRILPDGRVRVGCKWFTSKGADQVIRAAKRVDRGFELADFETDSGENQDKFHHYVTRVGDDNRLDFDGDDSQDVCDIIALSKVREKIMARFAKRTQPKVKVKAIPIAKPFRIFPAVKARKKSKPRK